MCGIRGKFHQRKKTPRKFHRHVYIRFTNMTYERYLGANFNIPQTLENLKPIQQKRRNKHNIRQSSHDANRYNEDIPIRKL